MALPPIRDRGRRRKEIVAMTVQPAVFGIPRLVPLGEGPQVVPGQADEPLASRCTRCGAVGTHYLTCPDLRLPSGYRLGDARRPEKH